MSFATFSQNNLEYLAYHNEICPKMHMYQLIEILQFLGCLVLNILPSGSCFHCTTESAFDKVINSLLNTNVFLKWTFSLVFLWILS